ncbi:YggU family protein [Candidatus Woesearchaeota archaeon]|nr:YggU family protein [Candidatus Woesearchaeota archaeon]
MAGTATGTGHSRVPEGSTAIRVTVRPRARKAGVVHDEERDRLIVSVRNPAEGGKANAELLRLLAKEFGRKVRVVAGNTSKNKLVRFL